MGGGGCTVRRQKFFKILLPGSFESRLCLPRKFAARLEWPGGAAATLRDPTGRLWDVDLVRDGGQDYLSFAGKGWRSFIDGGGLSAGHMLVFEHLGGLEFTVEPFDASGCLSDAADGERGAVSSTGASACDREDETLRRRMSTAADMESGNDGIKRKRSRITDTAGSCDQEDEMLRRRIERPYQLRYLDLTKSFCDRVGWTTSRTAEFSVAGDQRRWKVSVKVASKNGLIMAGWMDFAQDNRLCISNTCVFKPLIRGTGSLLQVQILRGS